MTPEPCHSLHLMRHPTPDELLARVRRTLGVESDDDLYMELRARGLTHKSRTVARWKSGEAARRYEAMLLLLALGGYLREIPDDRSALEAAEAALRAAQRGHQDRGGHNAAPPR